MLAAVVAPGRSPLFVALGESPHAVDSEMEVDPGEAVAAEVVGRHSLLPGDVGLLVGLASRHDGSLRASGWRRLGPPAPGPVPAVPCLVRAGPGARAEALDDDLVLWLALPGGARVRAPLEPGCPWAGYAAFGLADPDRFRATLLPRLGEYAFHLAVVGSEARAVFPDWESMRDAPSSLAVAEGDALALRRPGPPSREYVRRARAAGHPINGERSVPAWNVEEDHDGDGKPGEWTYRLVAGYVPYGFRR